MVLLGADPFLNELNKLFDKGKGKDAIYITLKRTNLKPRKSRKEHPKAKYLSLVRAQGGKKKISVQLEESSQARFSDSFGTILRAHMDSLKKREKTRTLSSRML
ncbi:hypothetical protein WJX74_003719 [Apatococcus lobatus]|uniref:Signal recognition particle 14 kDa protein n=1 Tax=Apatococcus lobatus TaxID=904363 RepID=A0AAW1R0L9_9CHLO